MATSSHFRPLLVALTRALESRAPYDGVTIDVRQGRVTVRSRLDDEEDAASTRGSRAPSEIVVLAPDGLWEWRVRRDFVRALPKGLAKEKLGATLGGPKTRTRFAHALQAAGGPGRDGALVRGFAVHRRTQLRRWAAQVIRWAYARASTP